MVHQALSSRLPAGLKLSSLAITSAVILTGVIFIPTFMGALWIIAGGRLTDPAGGIILILGVILALGAGWRLDRTTAVPAALVVIVLISLATVLSAISVDHSYDGSNYHLQAIKALARGWNPIRESYQSYRAPGSDLLDFIDSYGKTGWILAALQMSLGLTIEAAKNVSLITTAAAFLATFGVATRLRCAAFPAFCLAVMAAVSPLAIQEALMRMNDGEMSSCVTIFLAGLALWIIERDRAGLFMALPAMMFGVALKLSGLPIFVILCVAAVVADGARSRNLKSTAVTAGILMVGGVVGVLIMGFSPFVTNTVQHGSPYYPVSPGAWAAMMEGDWPKGFEHASAITRLVRSFFSATGYDPVAKIPMTFSRPELETTGDVEVMVGGMGPFYSAASLVSLVAAAVMLARPARLAANQVATTCLIFACGILLSSLPLPQSWYFRYVPHIWLFPVLIAAAAWSSKGWPRKFAVGIAGIISLNIAFVAVSYIRIMLRLV